MEVPIINEDRLTMDRLRARRFTDFARKILQHVKDRSGGRGIFGELPPLMIAWSILRWEDRVGAILLKSVCHDRWALEMNIDDELTLMEHATPQIDMAQVSKIFDRAEDEAKDLGHGYVSSEHLVLALCSSDDPVVQRIFEKHGITYEQVKSKLEDVLRE